MKVAVDARPLLAKEVSGIPEYVGLLINALTKAHPEVEWLLFYSSWQQKPRQWQWLGERPNVCWYPLQCPNKLINATAWLIDQPKLDKYCPADIWLLPHFNFTPLSGTTPAVLTIHDLSFLRQPEFFSWRRRFWHASLHLNRLANKVNKIVAISESTRRDIINLLGVPENKVTVIYSAVGRQFQPLASDNQQVVDCRHKYNLPSRFILSLATCEPRKNLVSLIEAYNIFRQRRPSFDCPLIIVGGHGWRQGLARKAWQESPYREAIRWLGYLPADDLPALYNLASVVVYPSFYEGFGLPVLEAMACGRPVITSAVTALPEVGDGAAILIDPVDVNALARSIEQILLNEELAKELSHNGLEWAQQFSWEKTAQEYWQILTA